jgi:hypothetical protein
MSLQDDVPRNSNNNAAFKRYQAELKTILRIDIITVSQRTRLVTQSAAVRIETRKG